MGQTYYADLGGTRILSIDGSTDHSGADDANVTGWDVANDFIFALCIHSASKDTESSTYKLQWEDTASPGFTDLAATGEMNFNCTAAWAHGATVATGDQKCDIQGGDTRQAGERIKETSLSDAIDLPDEYQSELWFGIDCAGAEAGHTYRFQLYSTAEGAAIGIGGAELTIATSGAPLLMDANKRGNKMAFRSRKQ